MFNVHCINFSFNSLGIKDASSVTNVLKVSTHEIAVKGPTRRFTAKHVTAKSSDLKAMAMDKEVVRCNLMIMSMGN